MVKIGDIEIPEECPQGCLWLDSLEMCSHCPVSFISWLRVWSEWLNGGSEMADREYDDGNGGRRFLVPRVALGYFKKFRDAHGENTLGYKLSDRCIDPIVEFLAFQGEVDACEDTSEG